MPNGLTLKPVLAFALALALPMAAAAEPFEYIRIGDEDGFGFAPTSDLVRASAPPHLLPADSDGNGLLGSGEFLPDLNRDGGVAWVSQDNFDNRTADERANRQMMCVGCAATGPMLRGSNWTDLSLSLSSPNVDWPDENGPNMPNNAVFIFEFSIAAEDIVAGSRIFFNLVFGDYDVDPAVVAVAFKDAPHRTLQLRNQGPRDGLIQARSSVLEFDEVFTDDGQGAWDGYVRVAFLAPNDPYTAFDFVELSLFDIVSASAEGALGLAAHPPG